jgi:hypothetical protein
MLEAMSPSAIIQSPVRERLTLPLTVRSELRKRWSAQRWAVTYSHGGSQGFKSPHLHPTTDDQRYRWSSSRPGRARGPHNGWRAPNCARAWDQRSPPTRGTAAKRGTRRTVPVTRGRETPGSTAPSRWSCDVRQQHRMKPGVIACVKRPPASWLLTWHSGWPTRKPWPCRRPCQLACSIWDVVSGARCWFRRRGGRRSCGCPASGGRGWDVGRGWRRRSRRRPGRRRR